MLCFDLKQVKILKSFRASRFAYASGENDFALPGSSSLTHSCLEGIKSSPFIQSLLGGGPCLFLLLFTI